MAIGLSTNIQDKYVNPIASGFATANATNAFMMGLASTVSALLFTNLPVRAITQYGNFLKAATPFLKAYPALIGHAPRLVALNTVSRFGTLNWPYGG